MGIDAVNPIKLHVGCGSVYLDGYMNIDVPDTKTFLAVDRKDLVEKWRTTDDAYFAKHQDKTQDALRSGPLDQEYVCDAYGDFSNLPSRAWEVSEILARHSFEHLSIREAHKALDQCDEVMMQNGILRLDVPDHSETCKLMRETGDEFYERHLLGPRRNEYGFHLMSYTRDRLKALVESHGFVFQYEEPNIHFYPAFTLRFIKPGIRPPYEYVDLPEIADSWYVGEVGPGEFPFPRAQAFIDIDAKRIETFTRRGFHTAIGDLSKGLPQIVDNAFDFVYCSHVLEHVVDIRAAAATLCRIGRRGVVVVPSFAKEAVGWFEEQEHAWLILPHPETGALVCVRRNNRFIAKLADAELQKLSCHQFRIGPNRRRDDAERYSRQWWYKNEASLDIVATWDEKNPLKVQAVD